MTNFICSKIETECEFARGFDECSADLCWFDSLQRPLSINSTNQNNLESTEIDTANNLLNV